MKIQQEFTHAVREAEHVELTLPDGCRLAARIWMPEHAADAPVPAILEYLPYRKNDHTLARDAARAPYIAGHGYAYVRVDLRGSGDSEGLMLDEYLPQELQDGCDTIKWIAEQPWCDGQVGMVGISWGGFNGLQIAALQPPALKAVVSLCSTDDRYADDIHYMGGALLCEQISWASTMLGLNTLPPDPRHVGARWREMWMQRLTGSGLWLKNWLEHQTRDEFWKHGSICEAYEQIQVPVYAVSGWADGYCRSVFRLMENLSAPTKGLIGPWAHKYPHIGRPGPAIDWLGEELRWWDHWLKGRDTGLMEEPQLRLFMQDHAPPQGDYDDRAGRWVTEPSWPSPNVTRVAFGLSSDGRLRREGPVLPNDPMAMNSPLTVGLGGGKWCSYANPGDQPVDQARDDADSLTFQTDPLDEPIEIAGDPLVDLVFTSDRPVASVAARLVDVAPNGSATRVSYGLLNLTHRDSHEKPAPLVPGQVYRARVPLKHVAQTFRKGHRLRLALSTNYFPLAWPAPEAATLVVHTAATFLNLPLRAMVAQAPAPFGEAAAAPPVLCEVLDEPRYEWQVTRHDDGGAALRVIDDDGRKRLCDSGLLVAARGTETYAFNGADYSSLSARVDWTHEMSRDDWRVRTLTETRFYATASEFRIEARVQAWEGDTIAHDETWDEAIPRQLV